MGTANAQTTQLTVETDEDSYATGDTITVTGQLTATNINQPILIQVLDPQGNRVRIDQFPAGVNGSYSYDFPAGGLMDTDGTYTVMVSYRLQTKRQRLNLIYRARPSPMENIQASLAAKLPNPIQDNRKWQ